MTLPIIEIWKCPMCGKECEWTIDHTKDLRHGDYYSNVAIVVQNHINSCTAIKEYVSKK